MKKHTPDYNAIGIAADALMEFRGRTRASSLPPPVDENDERYDATLEAEAVVDALRAQPSVRPVAFAWGAIVLAIVAMYLSVALHQLSYRHGFAAGDRSGFARGLTEGAAIAPLSTPADLGTELAGHAALALCREALAEAENQAGECGAAIDEAEVRGWERGYATSRHDWTALPYDCLSVRR
jgi:hypothetical protein